MLSRPAAGGNRLFLTQAPRLLSRAARPLAAVEGPPGMIVPDAVRRQRVLLGIPNLESNCWAVDEDELVRSLPAREAAARTGRSISAVYSRRRELRLPDGLANKGRQARARAIP